MTPAPLEQAIATLYETFANYRACSRRMKLTGGGAALTARLARGVGVFSLALGALACDGDGAHGGPSGPATKFCQERLANLETSALAAACERCCVQEVKYRGVVAAGRCVCR